LSAGSRKVLNQAKELGSRDQVAGRRDVGQKTYSPGIAA
jgi:hypothetical protein